MSPSTRRNLWIIVAVVGLAVLGLSAFWVGIGLGRGAIDDDLPMRGWDMMGWSVARPGLFGFLVFLGLAVLVGAAIGLVVSSVGRPPTPPPAGPPPTLPPVPPATGTPVAGGHQPASPVDAGLAQLQQLAALHDQGVLTDEEFTAAKRRLLGL
jgi:hypothetical protein